MTIEELNELIDNLCVDCLRENLKEACALRWEYRTNPNCGEYGVYEGWIKRVDELLERKHE